jgi:hypothetical protein
MEEVNRPEGWGGERLAYARRRGSVTQSSAFNARFWIAIAVFLSVAIAYPWYSYRVNSYLLSREMEAAAREMARIADETLKEAQREGAEAAERFKRDQQRKRIANVRIRGVSDGPKGPVVIVDLGTASPVESDQAICRQATAWLKANLSGTTLNVQRYRINQPALDAGVVVCP